MPDYIYSGFGYESVQQPQLGGSEPNLICWQGSLELIWLRVYAEPSETGLRNIDPYRSWWWWVPRWGERSQTLLAGVSPPHACAAAHRSAVCITTRQSWLTSQADIAWLTWGGGGFTGISRMQSSVRQSLVTQCRNTVDIFWCRCLTKRKTSKEKRPIWLTPFSKTVVCGSLLQLQKTHRWAPGDAWVLGGGAPLHSFGMSHFEELEWIMSPFCGLSSQHLEEGTKWQITERKGHSGVHH